MMSRFTLFRSLLLEAFRSEAAALRALWVASAPGPPDWSRREAAADDDGVAVLTEDCGSVEDKWARLMFLMEVLFIDFSPFWPLQAG
jgi:hypothetical protein